MPGSNQRNPLILWIYIPYQAKIQPLGGPFNGENSHFNDKAYALRK